MDRLLLKAMGEWGALVDRLLLKTMGAHQRWNRLLRRRWLTNHRRRKYPAANAAVSPKR